MTDTADATPREVTFEELRHLPIEQAARWYVAHGLAIVPLIGKNPAPYGADWCDRPITDPDEASRVFASDSRWTNIGWVQGYGTVAFDIDHQTELDPEVRSELRRGAVNDTRGPGRGHRIFALPDGVTVGCSTKGFPGGGWGEVRGTHGQIVIWGPHPEVDGHRYCYDATQPVPPISDKLLGWLRPPSVSERGATPDEVNAFVAAHADGDDLQLIHQHLDEFDEQVHDGEAIHVTAVTTAVKLAKESAAGLYPAAEAVRWLQQRWEEAWQYRAAHPDSGRTRPGGGEFDGIIMYAVGQALGRVQEVTLEELGVNPADLPPAPAEGISPIEQLVASANLLDWHEVFRLDPDDEDQRWLIPDLIARGRGHSLAAAAKLGKSEFVLWALANAALGRGIYGEAIEPVRILYADWEMTALDVGERMAYFGFSDTEADQLNQNLHYAMYPMIDPLDTRLGGQQVGALATHLGVDLVVLDTLSRAVTGDENDNATFLSYYNYTGAILKAHGIATFRLDHVGHKNKERARGGSAKAGDVDVILVAGRLTGGGLRLAATSRVGWYPAEAEFRRVENNDGTVAYTPLSPGLSDEAMRLVRLLDDHGVDPGWGRPAVREWFGKHHPGVVLGRNAALSEAIRFRKAPPVEVVEVPLDTLVPDVQVFDPDGS